MAFARRSYCRDSNCSFRGLSVAWPVAWPEAPSTSFGSWDTLHHIARLLRDREEPAAESFNFLDDFCEKKYMADRIIDQKTFTVETTSFTDSTLIPLRILPPDTTFVKHAITLDTDGNSPWPRSVIRLISSDQRISCLDSRCLKLQFCSVYDYTFVIAE